MFVYLSVLIQKLFLLPKFLAFIGKDCFFYIKDKWWLIFEGWGLHVYTGRFGATKTSSMVYDAYNLAKKYKQLTILTNFKLMNFPKWTKILPLKSPKDIINAPNNTLVLIDEIGTIFNSRDFSTGKESVPKILFQHLCQCRKRHLMIFATSQKWRFVDKQLRDIVATVRACKGSFAHPFTRMSTVYAYDSDDYDLYCSNPMLPITPLYGYAYVQTDKIRKLYDTSELIDNMLKDKYISDEEILANRGEENRNVMLLDKEQKKTFRKTWKH